MAKEQRRPADPVRYWLNTGVAAQQLGVSAYTLRRWRHDPRLNLKEGIHYRPGVYNNSPTTWDVEAVRQAHARIKPLKQTFKTTGAEAVQPAPAEDTPPGLFITDPGLIRSLSDPELLRKLLEPDSDSPGAQELAKRFAVLDMEGGK